MNIIRFPGPLLREKSKKIRELNPEIKGFINELKNTMYINKGCVGIAAPQAGELKRVVVVDVTGHPAAKKSNGLLVLVNPRLISKSGRAVTREGCLSVPDFTGNVRRAGKITVEYTDISGKEKQMTARGFEAVVIQHEIDHLDGILFIDRIRNSKRDLFARKNY